MIPEAPGKILKPTMRKARELAAQFIENFKEYEDSVGPEVIAAGPQIPPGKKAAIKQIK